MDSVPVSPRPPSKNDGKVLDYTTLKVINPKDKRFHRHFYRAFKKTKRINKKQKQNTLIAMKFIFSKHKQQCREYKNEIREKEKEIKELKLLTQKQKSQLDKKDNV